MTNIFSSGSVNEVIYANYCHFKNGMIHPDRVMEMHDIVYVVEGEWEIYEEDTCYTVRKNEVIVLPAGRHHYGVKKCKEDTHTMYLHIKDINPQEECFGESQIKINTIIDCSKNIEIHKMFEDIIEVFWSDTAHKEVMLSAKAKLLLCELSIQESKSYKGISHVEEALQIIRLEPQKFFAIQELSELVNIHPRTFIKDFKAMTMQTVHQYQLNLKLKMAYAEIEYYNEISFRDIASQYGFYDEFHFSKAFKHKYGFSPKQIRKKEQ